MVGGGGWEPGEWTDDTSMAIAIAEVAATGVDLRDASAQDAIVQRWYEWSRVAKDIGIQTSSVLRAAARGGVITAASARAESAKLHERGGRTGGNGALMRTAPVALAYLDDEDAMVEAARAISELTHFEPDAGDACVLWCSAIRHAVLTGELDVRVGLHHVEAGRRDTWAKRLDDAESAPPASFPNNGWVVTALQAAWSAIATTPVPVDDSRTGVFRADHLRLALDAAVRAGYDTDTVAAIAGGLLGAAYGASAVPGAWRMLLHGWPGITAHGLVALATAIERKGKPDGFDFSYSTSAVDTYARHPYDDGVLLGGIGVLRQLPAEVDAIVSLCRLADEDMRDDMPHVEVRLIDRPEHDENPHLDFVLLDTVQRYRAVPTGGTHSVGALRGGVQPHTDDRGAVRRADAQMSAARRRCATYSRRCRGRTRTMCSETRCGASAHSPHSPTREGNSESTRLLQGGRRRHVLGAGQSLLLLRRGLRNLQSRRQVQR